MEIRKSKKADLEKNIPLFFQTGLIIALLLVLMAFGWTTKPGANENVMFLSGTPIEIEEMPPTLRKETKPELVFKQKPADFILLVDDHVSIEGPTDIDIEIPHDIKIGPDHFIFDDYEPIRDEPFIIVEDMPLFNGGDPAMEFGKYIAENLRYPSIALENGISGRVIVQFVINAQGRVTDAFIIGSVDPALDKEALRVVLSSPPWTPGKQRGKPVKVLYYFPINFVLHSN